MDYRMMHLEFFLVHLEVPTHVHVQIRPYIHDKTNHGAAAAILAVKMAGKFPKTCGFSKNLKNTTIKLFEFHQLNMFLFIYSYLFILSNIYYYFDRQTLKQLDW
jgi:hypothetical protein